jgi:general stress protein 26
MRVTSFTEIEADFLARVREIVWCNVATVDRRGRPCSRVLHPIWEGATGWILTDRHSTKEKHLASNPYVSLCYANANLEQVYAESRAEWEDRPAEKARLWDLFAATPPPVGYDPITFWPDGKEAPRFGVIRLIPWRIEVTSLADLMKGGGKVWQRE